MWKFERDDKRIKNTKWLVESRVQIVNGGSNGKSKKRDGKEVKKLTWKA